MAERFCGRCGHSSDWHRLDDGKNIAPTDPRAEFRCLGYDCEAPGPWVQNGCECPDFVWSNPMDEHSRLWNDEIAASSHTTKDADCTGDVS